MARAIRIDFPGALHHVIVKGNRDGDIFYNANDKKLFLSQLSSLVKKYGFTLYAYCLMDNHIHLLIETGDITLSKLMGELLTRYVQGFNKRWNKKGHLLGDRYKSILVDKESYLLVLVRYIHLNPVKAGIVKLPKEYPWSSYREYLKTSKFISTSIVLSYFKDVDAFRKFTIEGIKKRNPSFIKVQNHLVYGDKEFMGKILDRIEEERRGKQRKVMQIKVSDVNDFLIETYQRQIEDIEKYTKDPIRRIAVVLLRDRVHLTFKEISKIFNISSQAVHKIYNNVLGQKKILKMFSQWMEKG